MVECGSGRGISGLGLQVVRFGVKGEKGKTHSLRKRDLIFFSSSS